MSYIDIGFTENLLRDDVLAAETQEFDPLQFDQVIQEVPGSKIKGIIGDDKSKIQIDLDKGEILLKDISNIPRVFFADGILKISRKGVDVTTTDKSGLILNSDFAYIREIQMQCIPEQRSTNAAPYSALNDARIKIDFSDWVDFDMYFELLIKAGDLANSLASARLFNVTDGVAIGGSNITTRKQTTPEQIRVGPIEKPDSGIKVFRVEYGHTPFGGVSDFVDIYIGRIIMRSKLI